MLLHLEANQEIELLKGYGQRREEYLAILSKLQLKGLGDFYLTKTHVEKFEFSVQYAMSELLQPIIDYRNCYLEITNECPVKCEFCKNSEMKNWLNCQSCFMNHYHQRKKINYARIVGELEELELNELTIRGGEPFMNIQALKEMVEWCKKSNKMNITITTPGSIDIEKMLEILTSYSKIKINLVVFYTPNLVEKDDVYQSKLVENQEKLIKVLREKGIEFCVTLQLCEFNRDIGEKIYEDIVNNLKVKPSVADIVNISRKEKLTHIRQNEKVVPVFRDSREFYMKQYYNRCLKGIFAIDVFGNVKPCPGMNKIIGNVCDETLHKILGMEELYFYWKYNKSKVPGCQNCSMRYYCADCSIFEMEEENDSGIHDIYCPVDSLKYDLLPENVNFKQSKIQYIE